MEIPGFTLNADEAGPNIRFFVVSTTVLFQIVAKWHSPLYTRSLGRSTLLYRVYSPRGHFVDVKAWYNSPNRSKMIL